MRSVSLLELNRCCLAKLTVLLKEIFFLMLFLMIVKSRFAISVYHICILMAFSLSPKNTSTENFVWVVWTASLSSSSFCIIILSVLPSFPWYWWGTEIPGLYPCRNILHGAVPTTVLSAHIYKKNVLRSYEI